MDISILVAITLSLFLILNPFSALPIFMAMVKGIEEKTVKLYANKVIIVAVVFLLVFTYIGPALMNAMGVTMNGFRVAGGIMLIFIAVQTVFNLGMSNTDAKEEIPWVIVATPVLAGPGAITQAILLSNDYGMIEAVVACVVSLFVIWILLWNSTLIVKVVGEKAIDIFSRVIGLLIGAMGVEYMFAGAYGWYGAYQSAQTVLTCIQGLI